MSAAREITVCALFVCFLLSLFEDSENKFKDYQCMHLIFSTNNEQVTNICCSQKNVHRMIFTETAFTLSKRFLT